MSDTQYSQVAEQIRRDIFAERFRFGSRLPAERSLCDIYDVSRITVRQALALLESEQLVIRRQGSGTYVAQNPSRRIPLMLDYTGSVQDHAPSLTRRLMRSEKTLAPAWAADELKLTKGTQVLYAERVDYIADTAVAWDEVFICSEFATAVTPDVLSRVDFLEAWCEVQNFKPLCCRQRVEANAAGVRDNKYLGLPSCSPLLKAFDTYEISRNRLVGLFVSHYHPNFITITSRVDYGGGA